METADVVVIGGGVVGCSIAYHLAKGGVREVCLLEKNELLGAESTGCCLGGIRHQFSTEINVRLSLESSRRYESFQEEMGVPINLRRHGYLFLVGSEEGWSALKEGVALQRQLGIDTRLLRPDQVQSLVSLLNLADIKGGSFCPLDGSADPHLVTQGYAQRARQLGVKIFTQREVQDIKLDKGRVVGVLTNRGTIATPMVINAAGPYAAKIGRMVGVDIPVVPHRRQIFVAELPQPLSDGLPLVIDLEREFYFKQEGRRFLLCKKVAEDEGFNKVLDWSSLDELIPTAIHRVPLFIEARIVGGWAGLRSITPDKHAILGYVPGLRGFICAVGFSGHGFMHAPITGQLIAELVLEGKTLTLDITPLGIERFQEGRLIEERNIF